ncbi:ABC transporter permease [Mucilaginibacter sp. RS28]|uniref:ABC transporter permease n=1 Tax=Mucilaginibacter straminoryzae TaxID=2932774 RepID=A0A9X2BB38_9SPHI|nr:ABC transporter permease [Mucilaginibacter straminoryzae]MCJ8211395.1 ABC transporter permease [Mucilaginibacter straminoryzae]
MFRNYLLSAIRSFKKYRLFSFLNVFGLATGLACSILILLWVQDEVSFDKFNKQANQIYRITADVSGSKSAVTPPPLPEAVRQQLPIVKRTTTVVPITTMVSIGTKKFDERHVLYADSNFLRMFDYALAEGNREDVLNAPNGVVITASTAKKYFGNADAVGKTILVNNDINGNSYVVKGVLRDIPSNSHLKFDILLPIDFYNKSNATDWGNYSAYSYLELDKNFKGNAGNIAMLEKQIDAIYKEKDNSDTKSVFNLQPLTDIHLHSNLLLEVEGQGNSEHVRIFSIVAIFILLIAAFNYMNLSTALAAQRAKEVGLRKTIGANKLQLVIQFMSESFMVTLLSLVVGLVIAWACLPLFNEISSKNITLNLFTPKLIGELVLLALVITFLSGLYPAFLLSSYQPVAVLKGLKAVKTNKPFLRNGLVILQFAISVVLIISTMVVNYQLKFIQGRNIGYSKENLMYVEVPAAGDLKSNYERLKATLPQQLQGIDYTITDHLPTYLTTGTTNVMWSGKKPKEQTVFPHIGADAKFLQTFKMQLLTGRTFNDDSKADAGNYLLNEAAVKLMGMTPDRAIGQLISSNGHPGMVIGVVKNFNFKPVQQAIEPLILRHTDRAGFLVIRIPGNNSSAMVNKLKGAFQDLYPNYPFNYGFVDEDINHLYLSEQRMGKLFNAFSAISIIISCLGLFGLATFTTQQRLKEIGVRRVLGASTASIVTLLSKDLVKLVMFALFIAFPVAWIMMNKWLDNYTYRIAISWWIFLLSGASAIFIAFLTISYQAFKAAFTNPTKSLKSE